MAQAEMTSSEKRLTPAACCVAHAWITTAALEALRREAEHRRMHPDAALATVLDYLLRRRMFGAMLDRAIAPPAS